MWIGDAVASLDDVLARTRERRLAELRAKSDGQPSQEWIKLLEDDNAALNDKVKELTKHLESLEKEKADLGDKIAHFEYEKECHRQRVTTAETEKRQLQTQLEAIESLTRLPESLFDIVNLIERIHAGQNTFTDRAKESARESNLNDIHKAWRCLWAMATTLYDLHFGGGVISTDLEQEFKSKTGFELSLREGKQTKEDKRLMALRKDQWKGKEIDITSHVKWGSKEPNLLRVHYCPEQDQQILVVGHCGDHLDTSGTRRKR